jgi:RNA polymerase sigma-70 factor, ECF subfamily
MDFFPFDDDYVRRLREGDRWTEEHFRSYFEQLLLIKLRRRLPSLEAIHDVRQEVFVRVFKTLRVSDGGIRDGRKLGAYVNTVCNNVVLELYRQTNRTEPLLDAHLDLPTSEDVADALVDSEERERVRRVVDQLPPRDRDILKALFFDERSNDDVCAEFGVDRNYLRVLLYRAKEKFRGAWGNKVVPMRPDETDRAKSSLSKRETGNRDH